MGWRALDLTSFVNSDTASLSVPFGRDNAKMSKTTMLIM